MSVSVLLVEDEKQVRAMLADLLAGLGDFVVVAEAATEAEARLWIEEHPGRWDLAVVDLVLEQGTGMGIIAKAKEHAGTQRVVVFSDYATPGIRRHCLQLGADAVFQKSRQLEEFKDYCRALLAQPPTAPRW